MKNKKSAFTLIELLVVVAIIGILATIVTMSLAAARAKSNFSRTVADMTNIAKSTNLYIADHNGTKPPEWSGFSASSFNHASDGAHTFSNTSANNDFLADYLDGSRPVPPCAIASYAYYDYSTYSVIKYHWSSTEITSLVALPVEGTFPSEFKNILNKSKKSISCKEASDAEFN